jgi:transposase
MLSIGIDWAIDRHTVVFLNAPGQVVATMEVENTVAGYSRLLEAIRRYGNDLSPADIVFAVEAKNLRLVEFLLASGYTGYLVDPNRMRGYRARYRSSGAKDDNFDAFVLGDILWRDRDQLSVISPETESVRRMKILLTDRVSFVGDATSLVNRLQACLREYYPAMLELFADVAGKTALAFLEQYPSLQHTHALNRDTLKTFLVNQHCYTRKRLLHMLKVLTEKSISIPEVVVELKQRTALRLVRQLQTVQQTIAAYDAEIEAANEGNPEARRFSTLPAAGPLISGTLYTLFGEDRSRYLCATDAQSYVGTAPRTIQSGQFRKTSFRFACQQDCRVLLTRWAFNSLRLCEWAERYYRSKRAQGKGHYHALRCLANILLKIAFAMWRDRTDYSEDRYLAQVARHQMHNSPKKNSSKPDINLSVA